MKMWTLAIVSCLVLSGCSKSTAPVDAGSPGGADTRAPRAPATLEIPGSPGADPAPGGKLSGQLTWKVPREWTRETPSSNMRQAQYRVPGSAGDAECVVFYFGPGQGGDAAANAVRWANQFTQPDGRRSVDVMQVENLGGATVPVQVVEVTGTYNGGMTITDAPAAEMPGYMLLGGIAEGPDAPWFFKFTGPEQTVREQRATFVKMMRSVATMG